MDTSREYIKMCAAASDIQKLIWDENVDHDGSFFYIKHKFRIFVSSNTNRGIHFSNIITDDVWLPRLDQLLEIAANHPPKEQYGIWVLQNFKEYVDTQLSRDHAWGLKFPTLEQMALSFIMSELHGMTWTGEAWEPARTREEELQKRFEEEDGQ